MHSPTRDTLKLDVVFEVVVVVAHDEEMATWKMETRTTLQDYIPPISKDTPQVNRMSQNSYAAFLAHEKCQGHRQRSRDKSHSGRPYRPVKGKIPILG